MRAGRVQVVLVVVLDVVPIDVVSGLLSDGAIGAMRILAFVGGEPGSDGSVGDEVLAGGKVRSECFGEVDEPSFSLARTVVDSVEIFVIDINTVKLCIPSTKVRRK